MITHNIKGTNLELTPDVREYLDKRFGAFEKFVDKDDTSAVCDAELERMKGQQTGDVFRAEATLHTRRGTVRAEARGSTIEAAIDKVKKETVRELRRLKKKELRLFKKGGTKLKDFTQGLSERGVRVKDFVVGWRRKK